MDSRAADQWAKFTVNRYHRMYRSKRDPPDTAYVAARLSLVKSIHRMAKVLPWISRSSVRSAQDHMTDALQAYCKHYPNWLDVPLSILPRPSETPLQRASRIEGMARELSLRLKERNYDPDHQIAFDLLNVVSGHHPTAFVETKDS